MKSSKYDDPCGCSGRHATMRDVVNHAYHKAGNPLDPNNKKLAEGFWTAGQPDRKTVY